MEESPDVFYANYDAYVDSYIVYSCMKYATRLCMLKRTVDGYQSYLMMCAFKSGSFASTVNYDQFGIKRRLSVRPERFNDYRRNASFIVKQRFPTPLGY
jgi:hypothetical protein